MVEDEDGVRELMQAWLESHGYRVLVAGNGVEALERRARPTTAGSIWSSPTW